MIKMHIAAGALALAALAGSCAGGDAASQVTAPTTTSAPDAVVAAPDATASTPAPVAGSGLESSPLSGLVQPAGSLLFDPSTVAAAPQPTSVDIEGIGVAEAAIRDVGIETNGEMEVPGAGEVGWYRWSPSPGREGSAVLAAHIAYNGTDGVFRNLEEVDVGARVTIRYDDGSVRDFEIIETSQYPKDELPFDRIFAKDGDPMVALITCGGTFNPTLRSYDDNVVAYAVPV